MTTTDGFLRVHLDVSDIERGFKAFASPARERTTARVFRMLKDPLRLDQQQHAKEQVGPDGKWQARAASTMARRAEGKGHRSPAKPLGRLIAAVVYQATARGVTAASRVAWSLAQQEGGNVGRGHKSKLPARPFLWISDQVLEVATEFFGDYFRDAWGAA